MRQNSGTVTEYEDGTALYETSLSQAEPLVLGGETYWIAYSRVVPIESYEEALLMPEWEVFA